MHVRLEDPPGQDGSGLAVSTMGLPSFIFQTAPQSEWLLDISASKHVCIKRIHLKPGRVFFCLS